MNQANFPRVGFSRTPFDQKSTHFCVPNIKCHLTPLHHSSRLISLNVNALLDMCVHMGVPYRHLNNPTHYFTCHIEYHECFLYFTNIVLRSELVYQNSVVYLILVLIKEIKFSTSITENFVLFTVHFILFFFSFD